MIGLGIIVAFGAGLAVLALAATLCGMGLWIVGNATVDAVRVLYKVSRSFDRIRSGYPATIR